MPDYNKNKKYKQDADAWRKEFVIDFEKMRSAAEKTIHSNLGLASKFFTSIIERNIDPEEVPALRLKSEVAKHLLKLGGLEIDRTEHSGSIEFTPVSFEREGASE